MIAVIASERTYGAKKIRRSRLRPRIRPVEEQRGAERERQLEDEREHDEDAVVLHRLAERRVAEGLAVVVEPDVVGQRTRPFQAYVL